MLTCEKCIDHTSIPYTMLPIEPYPMHAIDKYSPVFGIYYDGIPPLHQFHVDWIINRSDSNPNIPYYHTFSESPLFLNNCSLYKEASEMFIGNYSKIKIGVFLETSEKKRLEVTTNNFVSSSSFDQVLVKIYAKKKHFIH